MLYVIFQDKRNIKKNHIIYQYLWITSFPCRYRGSRQRSHAGFVGDAYTPANETTDLESLNVTAVSDMCESW